MKLEDLKRLVDTDWRLNGRVALKKGAYRWKHPMRLLNGMDVEQITVSVIEKYKADRHAEGAAPQTINNETDLIRKGLRLAFHQELLPRIPRVARLRVQNVREGFVDPPEFLRLVKALEVLDPPVADVITWLYLLGWRREEILGLVWDEVNVEGGMVRLPAARTKNRTQKTVKVGNMLGDLLRRRWSLRSGPWVFHREGLKIRTFTGPWRRAAKAIGRPELKPHDLRRSFARNALAAGLDIPLIMAIGGWKTMSVFLRYAIQDERRVEAGIERVCEYTEQKSATKKRKGEREFFALPRWLTGALKSLSEAQRAEALDLMRSYDADNQAPDST